MLFHLAERMPEYIRFKVTLMVLAEFLMKSKLEYLSTPPQYPLLVEEGITSALLNKKGW
jgi:hypothetical protein